MGRKSAGQYLVKDCRQYDFAMAQWIAHEHAKGDSLQKIHECHPDDVPSPLVIARWRREFPAFDSLMVHAEKARAALLAEQVLEVADNTKLPAAKTANKMKARQWLAGKMDPARFGSGAQVPGTHAPPPANGDSRSADRALSLYSDDDLQDIIRAGLKARSIEGTSTRIDPPGTPPTAESQGVEAEDGSATSESSSTPQKPSVTTNDIPDEHRNDEPEF